MGTPELCELGHSINFFVLFYIATNCGNDRADSLDYEVSDSTEHRHWRLMLVERRRCVVRAPEAQSYARVP